MIKSKPCRICESTFHTAMYHKPKKAIKQISDKKKLEVVIKTKPKKAPKSDRAKAKERAWKSFSEYIRTRDCIRFTGDKTEGMCITCKRGFTYKQLQAGHFVGGRGNAVLFDERLVYSQCGHCNQKPPMGLGGNYAMYALFMIDEWGRETTEEFLRLKGTTKVYKAYDFEEIEVKYKTKLRELTK